MSSVDGRDEDADDDSDDDELLAELNDGDIPVTGFAVASNKRNADFHELFRRIPEGDYLIEGAQPAVYDAPRLLIAMQTMVVHCNVRSSFKGAYTFRRTIFASMPISSVGSPVCVKHPCSNCPFTHPHR